MEDPGLLNHGPRQQKSPRRTLRGRVLGLLWFRWWNHQPWDHKPWNQKPRNHQPLNQSIESDLNQV
jgi:hypothetical protein